MRVLLYGMQSSGASLLAFTLAQRPDSIAFVDIWNMFAVPHLSTDRDCVAKAVVTTAYGLEVHRRRFRPDVTLLVLRHPIDTYNSLSGKSYANESGLIYEKFGVLEEVFRTGTEFDHLVHYEDFVFSPCSFIDLANRIGWRIEYDALLFRRTSQDIRDSNAAAFPGIQTRLKYGAGQIHSGGIRRDLVMFSEPTGMSGFLPLLCPSVFEHYSALRADRGALWHVPSPALLSCGLGAIVRKLAPNGVIPKQSERGGYGMRLIGGTRRCSVTDEVLCLCPAANGRETRLVVSGLPGKPFNRIRGTAYTERANTSGTDTRIRIEDTAGEGLAEQTFTLQRSEMRFIDLAFEPAVSGTALTLGVRLSEGAAAAADPGVYFRDLRLEHVTA